MANLLLYGTENLLKQEFLSQVKKKFKTKYGSFNSDQIFFDESKITPQELQMKIQAMPFLGQKRLLIIHNLLGSTNFRTKKGKIIIDQLKKAPEATYLFLVEGELNKKGIINQLKTNNFQIKEFKPIYGYQLTNWIERRVSNLKLSIDRLAVQLITDYLSNDTGLINQELIKLKTYLAYHQRTKIEAEDVKEVVSPKPNLAIFDLLDRVGERKYAQASQQLEDMLDGGISESYIITMLEMTISNLLMAKDYSERKSDASVQTFQRKFRWHPFVAQKVFKQIHNFDKKNLVEYYQKLLETDLKLKTGQSTPKLELTLLLSQL